MLDEKARIMQIYQELTLGRQRSFETAIQRCLTRQSPPKRNQQGDSSSSGEDSVTVDPRFTANRRFAPGAPEFLRNFRSKTIERVVVDHLTVLNCEATMATELRDGDPVTYFPWIGAISSLAAWDKLENIVKSTCETCAIPFFVLD